MHEQDSRCLLHKSKLDAFKKWLVGEGWIEWPTKSVWEVLRMRRQGAIVLVYTKADLKEHYTTHGEALKQVRIFIRESKSD